MHMYNVGTYTQIQFKLATLFTDKEAEAATVA